MRTYAFCHEDTCQIPSGHMIHVVGTIVYVHEDTC